MWLEDIILADPKIIYEQLSKIFGVTFNLLEITQLLNKWRNLHWDYNDTYNWEFGLKD
jgi:hypothetical protein